MKITYIGARPREVAPVGHRPFSVEPGGTVDVPEPVAKSLLRQTDLWEKPADKAATGGDKKEK